MDATVRAPQISRHRRRDQNPMTTRTARRDFDRLSPVYDETRQPLDLETIEGLREFVREHGWTSVLEVGVGTGRIAEPLAQRGLQVTGVDASRGMLRRAHAKGIPRLVQGSDTSLPFRDTAFDVALFVHVLHILDEPGSGLTEAARVSHGGVLALMDRPDEGHEPGRSSPPTPREIVREVLADAGYPDLLRAGPRAKEREILRNFPPKEIRIVSDREVTEPLARLLDGLEKRAYRHLLDVPPEVLDRALATVRNRVGDRSVTYRRSEAVVWWPTL